MKRWIAILDPLYGNSGKGKVCAVLSKRLQPYACVECGSGPTAGHIINTEHGRFITRLIPPAFISSDTILAISQGVAIFEDILRFELSALESWDVERRLAIHPVARFLPMTQWTAIGHTFKEIIEIEHLCAAGECGVPVRNVEWCRPYVERWCEMQKCWSQKIVIFVAQHGAYLEMSAAISDRSLPPFRATPSEIAKQSGLRRENLDDIVLVIKTMPTTTLEAIDLPNQIPWPAALQAEFGLVSGKKARLASKPDFSRLKRFAKQVCATSIVVTFGDYLTSLGSDSSLLDSFVDEVEQQLELPVLFVSTGVQLDKVQWKSQV